MKQTGIILFYGIVLLSNLYSAAAQIIPDPKIPDSFLRDNTKVLEPTLIATNNFRLQWKWNPGEQGGTADFTVNVNKESCDPSVTCTETPCMFNSFAHCSNVELSPCDDITVNVTGGGVEDSISFNLAPDIPNNSFKPELTLSGNNATITWMGPVSTVTTACATRARATVQVGDDLMNCPDTNAQLGNTNNYPCTLDDCYHGQLTAVTVIYLTPTGGYPTNRLFGADPNNLPNDPYKGVGVTGVKATSNESQSLNVKWEVACPGDAENFTVTWEDTEGLSDTKEGVTDTTYTFSELIGGTYTVTVQAFWSDGNSMGDVKQSEATVVSQKKSKSDGFSGGEIAGIVIGCIAGVALIGIAIFFIVKRKK